MRMYYIDSSALMTIILNEGNASAMKTFAGSRLLTSQITRVEVIRSVLRMQPDRLSIATELLKTVEIIPVKSSIVSQAEHLPHTINIRGMDAIHLATVVSLDFLRIAGVITYDKQMAQGARLLGFEVFAPVAKK